MRGDIWQAGSHGGLVNAPMPGSRTPGRTLLIGAGKLAMQVGGRLLADGHDVVAIRRTPGALPAGFVTIAHDLRDGPPPDLPECDSVVITLPPGDVYPAALTHVAEGLPARPSRVVFVSSTRVFEGRPGPVPLTEADAPAPVGARAQELLEGERLAADLFGASIVRPAGIYGPGRDSVIRRVREGVPFDYSRRTNRIHEHDLARLLDRMLRVDDPPTLVHAVDQAPVTMGEVVTFIAQTLGIPRPQRIQPESHGGTVLDGSRLLEMLGVLAYPSFREGYAEMLR